MISPRRQLMGLLSSVSDCRTLLQSSVKSSNRDDGSCNCWLTEPSCALVRAQKLSRLTDMQLEALSAIQSFCLLCRRHQNHNASNAAAAVMAASTTARDRKWLHGNHQRPSQHRLGAFRSAIIRQLWEIHRLLLALIDVDKAQEMRPAKLHRKPMSGNRPRSLSAIEMQLDTTSSEVRCCGDNRRTGFGEQRFLTIPLHQECHNLQTPSSCSPTTTFEAKPHRKLNAASVRSNSVSEWSFACAAAADKQVCFASTVCVGKAGNASKAPATKAPGETRKSATRIPSRNYRGARAANDKQPLTGIDVMLLRKNYQQFVDVNTSSKSSPFSSSSNDNSATINSAVPELSSNSDRQYRVSKIREDIVFQRVLCTEAQSKAVRVGSSNAALVATLSGLKCRIDAIRQNLSERDGGCNGFSADSSSIAGGRKSRSCRPDRSRKPISRPVTPKPAGNRGPARNQSNLSLKAGSQPSERQLRCITARLDSTVTQLTRMLGSAMWLCHKRKSNLTR